MIEVELKAWVDDPAAVRARLDERYPLLATFRKEDTYFRMPQRGAPEPSRGAAESRPAEPPREFRIRIENGVATVTSKDKRLVDGIEVNRENEFTVSDPDAFERFALYVGAKRFVRKVKVGRLYDALGAVEAGGAAVGGVPGPGPQSHGEAPRDDRGARRSVHIELSEVERLGTFVEIEALLEEPDDREIERARGDIRELLERAGVDPSRIEPRYYIDMIASLDPRTEG